MHLQTKIKDMALLYYLNNKESENEGKQPPGSADYARETILQFTDFLAERGSEGDNLGEITDVELAAYYKQLKERSDKLINLVHDIKIIVSFLLFAEESGFFVDSAGESLKFN